MAQEYKQEIESIFEDVVNSKELASRFEYLHPSIYDEMIREAIVESGFPVNADLKKLRYEVVITNNQSLEKWSEQYMIENDLDEESTSVIGHDDIEMYVIDHLENMNVRIAIKDELNEWIERNPTAEYMEKQIESRYNPLEMISFMKRNNYVSLYQKEKACIDVGIPKEEASKVNYEVKNLRITTPINALAEVYSEEIKEANTTVQVYLDNNLYENLVTEVDYEVEVDKTEHEEL